MIKIDWAIQSSLLSKSLNKISQKKRANFSIGDDDLEERSSVDDVSNKQASAVSKSDSLLSLNKLSRTSSAAKSTINKSIQTHIKIGELLLSDLQTVQEKILSNSLSRNDLASIAQQLSDISNAIEQHAIPETLSFILNDIKVRIAVELEKYRDK